MNSAGKAKEPFLFGVNFEMSEGFFLSDPMQQYEVLFSVNGVGNHTAMNAGIPDFEFETKPEPFDCYQRKFDKVSTAIRDGAAELVNLTLRTPVETMLSLKEIFDYSSAKYRIYIPDKLVCFSPECFVKIENGKICSFPMKGTINAQTPDAEQKILNDTKEIEEHTAAVKLIKEDLMKVSSDVITKRFRYIDRIENHKGSLLQVSSEVEGVLQKNYMEQLGTLLFSLLPAGSVAGVPKKESLRIIEEAEQITRGYYTGIFGYFDGLCLDAAVMIRFIEVENDQFYYRSGGGITINSDCEKEYREAVEKIYLPFQPQ